MCWYKSGKNKVVIVELKHCDRHSLVCSVGKIVSIVDIAHCLVSSIGMMVFIVDIKHCDPHSLVSIVDNKHCEPHSLVRGHT